MPFGTGLVLKFPVLSLHTKYAVIVGYTAHVVKTLTNACIDISACVFIGVLLVTSGELYNTRPKMGQPVS